MSQGSLLIVLQKTFASNTFQIQYITALKKVVLWDRASVLTGVDVVKHQNKQHTEVAPWLSDHPVCPLMLSEVLFLHHRTTHTHGGVNMGVQMGI